MLRALTTIEVAETMIYKDELFFAKGSISYWINGKLHRENGPAYEGSEWFINNKRHRNDGPLIYKDRQIWYQNGKIHRDGSPAITYADGSKLWLWV